MTLISIAPILAASGSCFVRWEGVPLWSMAIASIPLLVAWVICIRFIADMEDKP